MVEYILSQVCVIIAVGVQVPMYFLKNKKIILVLAWLMCLLYGTQNLLLKAYPAALMNAVGIVRGIWYYINEARGKKQEYISLITCEAACLALGIIFYTNWPDIFSIAGSMMFNFAVWQPNILLFRYMTTVESILWIVHNWAYMSIAAVIVEAVVFCIKIVGVVRYYLDIKKEKAQPNENQKEESNMTE